MSKLPIVERCIGRADTLEALGRENRPLTSEHDVAAVVLTREILRDAATTITELVSALESARAHLIGLPDPEHIEQCVAKIDTALSNTRGDTK